MVWRDAVGEPQIAEAFGQPIGQPDRAVGGTEQQHTAVRRDRAAVESTHKFAPAASFRSRALPGYTVSASGSISSSREVVAAQQLSLSRSPDAPHMWEKFRLVAI